MAEAVVVASSRTPLAKSHRGSFNMTTPDDLLAQALDNVMGKVPQISKEDVEDVVSGCANPGGKQGSNIARIAAIRAGFPVSIAGTTVNRFCSSGLQAVAMAAHEVMTEGAVAAIGSGVESITFLPQGKPEDQSPWVLDHKPELYMAMGNTAETVAKRYGVSREDQDTLSLDSQIRTAAAQDSGFLDQEIFPMQVTRGIIDKETKKIVDQEVVTVSKDECNRPSTTIEGLNGLKPVFDPDSGKGTVTAGNSSQLSDGASATLLMNADKAKELGVKALIKFKGFAVAGCEPDEMGIGPIYAIPKLLKRHGLSVSDIDLWELNEAFAVQVVYCREKLGIPQDKLNVNGGSISIGHPFGMTGSRMVGTLAHEMQRRQAKLGVVTMCIGGGQGAAGLFELCD